MFVDRLLCLELVFHRRLHKSVSLKLSILKTFCGIISKLCLQIESMFSISYSSIVHVFVFCFYRL